MASTSKSACIVDRAEKDLSHIINFKCCKSKHFVNKYIDPKTNFSEK